MIQLADRATALRIRKTGTHLTDPQRAVDELYEGLIQPDIRLAVFYCSPNYDLQALGAALARRFGDIPLLGCTTAGEITPIGYTKGALTGVSIASDSLRVATGVLEHLSEFEFSQGHTLVDSLLQSLQTKHSRPTGQDTFGFLLIDGLSCREESVVSSIAHRLGSIQLFGGSAGDGLRFGSTHLYYNKQFHTDAAVFTLIQPGCPFEVFKTQHFVSSDKKMVVTQADPARRIVTEVNGEPAAREYARMVGLELTKLTPMIFSTHPVVVRIGGQYYVRSIQKVNEDESLTFFCAIDEGIVLTVAQGVDLVDNLRELFAGIRQRLGLPQLVLGCDCILRSLEMDQRGLKATVGQILNEHNVIGFATYGEQFNAMHVNQTFTGVAIGS